jgi:hypothetical protein
MAALKLPLHLIQKLGPEMKMDTHWVDVKLREGRTFINLVVQGGAYLTGRDTDPSGEGELPFTADDIAKLRRHSLLGALWPFWV